MIDNSEFSYDIINKIFNDCWTLYITNVHILVPSLSYQSVILYTYYPYTIDYCEIVKPIIQDTFINGTFIHNSNAFPDKFRNFFKCPLIVATYDFRPHVILTTFENGSHFMDGIDGRIFRSIANYLNFTPIIKLAGTNVLSNITVKLDSESNGKSLKPSLHMVIIH